MKYEDAVAFAVSFIIHNSSFIISHRSSVSHEAPVPPHEAEPRRIPALRRVRVELVDADTIRTLRAGHQQPAGRIAAEKNHHVRDVRPTHRLVSILPKQEVTGLQAGVTYTVTISGVSGALQSSYTYTFRIT